MTRTRFGTLACAAVLIFALMASRLPFMENVLIGEEGSHAHFVLLPPSAKSAEDGLPKLLVGEIGGKPVHDFIERTIVPYWILENVAVHLAPKIDIRSATDETKAAAARTPFLVLFAIGAAGLIALASRAGLAASTIVVFILLTPLAVGGSIQPQVDGGLGVALLGLAATLMIAGDRRQPSALYAVAGFLCGLGKHEWAAAFAIAALIAMVIGRSLRGPLLRFLIALVAASVLSFAISPINYIGGFNVMTRIYAATAWRATLFDQMQLLAPVLVMGALAAALLFSRRDWRARQSSIALFGAATIIMIGYGVSGWRGDGFPRYYAPALVLYAFVSVSEIAAAGNRLRGAIVALMLVGGGVEIAQLTSLKQRGVSITSGYGSSLQAQRAAYARDAATAKEQHAIVLSGAAMWLYHPGTEYISADYGEPGARAFVARIAPADAGRLVVK